MRFQMLYNSSYLAGVFDEITKLVNSFHNPWSDKPNVPSLFNFFNDLYAYNVILHCAAVYIVIKMETF